MSKQVSVGIADMKILRQEGTLPMHLVPVLGLRSMIQ